MNELPESTTLARQVNQNLVGKTISSAVAASSPHKFAWYHGDPVEYLAAGPIPTRHQLLLNFEDGTALSASLAMYGPYQASIDVPSTWQFHIAGQRLVALPQPHKTLLKIFEFLFTISLRTTPPNMANSGNDPKREK